MLSTPYTSRHETYIFQKAKSVNDQNVTKALIIAEKPSVAADLARALGGFTKFDDYFENEDYVISSAVGHLLEIVAPEDFEVKRGKWSFANLPVLPPYFDLKPIAKTESRLKILIKLLKRKDIGSIINACDAGREGELIFRLIVQYAKSNKPISRLWLQSMTPLAIREAFKKLRSDQDMKPLADAAKCRSEADWLIGINGTRAMTAFNSKEGGFYLTTVGRVQTPTLAIVVEREEKIRHFITRPYFEIKALFANGTKQYEGKWFNPVFQKTQDPDGRADRIWSQEQAQEIINACQNQSGHVTEECKPTSQISPQLFDLTSLQREANSRFGFSAKNTLAIAQTLYEKHKALTYPRTDSRALPEDYLDTSIKTLQEFINHSKSKNEINTIIEPYQNFAKKILDNGWVKPNKRVFDNNKVSDHFAIIPTLQTPKNLSEPEQKLYDMVVRRFLAVFYPAAEFLVTTRISHIGDHCFKTEGKILKNPGWMAVYGKEMTTDQNQIIAVDLKQPIKVESINIHNQTTKPAARYSEATLLSAMESAGKLVDDDELREAMGEKGLGTPATRAAIIEGLLTEKYLVRELRELIPTAKAFQLLTLLRGLNVKELSMPELTGEWEFKLSQMEKGKLSREQFMTEISNTTQTIVDRAKNYSETTVPGDYVNLVTPCPKCGSIVKENYRRFSCSNSENCDFSISKIPGGRQFEIQEVEQLLKEHQLPLLDGFRSKMGRPFSAILKLNSEHRLEFDFGQDNQNNDETQEKPDFSNQAPLGSCPKCGASVFDNIINYSCEKAIGADKTCDFKSGKLILQQNIEPEQFQKLLNQKKTDLLTRFISSKTRRPFKAYLVLKPDGSTGFEFEARQTKRPGKTAANKS